MNAPSVMDIHHILKKLPHRYPFLLVDRVIEIEKLTGVSRRVLRPDLYDVPEPSFLLPPRFNDTSRAELQF